GRNRKVITWEYNQIGRTLNGLLGAHSTFFLFDFYWVTVAPANSLTSALNFSACSSWSCCLALSMMCISILLFTCLKTLLVSGGMNTSSRPQTATTGTCKRASGSLTFIARLSLSIDAAG